MQLIKGLKSGTKLNVITYIERAQFVNGKTTNEKETAKLLEQMPEPVEGLVFCSHNDPTIKDKFVFFPYTKQDMDSWFLRAHPRLADRTLEANTPEDLTRIAKRTKEKLCIQIQQTLDEARELWLTKEKLR